MSTDRAKPDLIFVSLIHQALRVDGARLLVTVAALEPDDGSSRLSGVREFFDRYRQQLVSHHTHEDRLFFPALAARVGAARPNLDELGAQHEQLDGVLQTVGEGFAALADPDGDFSANRTNVADAPESHSPGGPVALHSCAGARSNDTITSSISSTTRGISSPTGVDSALGPWSFRAGTTGCGKGRQSDGLGR